MRLTLLLLIFIMSISFLKAQDTLVVIHKIHLEGNKVTKDNIIYREITFRDGDTIGKNIFQ